MKKSRKSGYGYDWSAIAGRERKDVVLTVRMPRADFMRLVNRAVVRKVTVTDILRAALVRP